MYPKYRGESVVYVRSTPHPVTVTTRIITFLVGDPYKTFISHCYCEGAISKVYAPSRRVFPSFSLKKVDRMSSDQNFARGQGYTGDEEILPMLYRDYFISHYKDPY